MGLVGETDWSWQVSYYGNWIRYHHEVETHVSISHFNNNWGISFSKFVQMIDHDTFKGFVNELTLQSALGGSKVPASVLQILSDETLSLLRELVLLRVWVEDGSKPISPLSIGNAPQY